MIKNLLHDLIDETKLRASSIDFGLVTYSLSTLKPFELFLNEIPFGEMIGYLMASASLPVFKLEKLDGNLFIDGGVFDNMPINLLIKNGYRDIIVIRTFGIGMYKKIIDPSVKVTYINPSEDLGGILDFDNKHANKNLSLGYYDTMKHFKNWKGSRFYIKPEPSDERAFSLLFNFSDEVVFDIGQIFGYNNIPAKRMLFEFIIPRIVDLLSLPKDSSYQDILIGICEEIAREINLDRFRLYSLDGFIKAITESYQPEKEKEKEKAKLNVHLQDFLKKNELLSKFVKDKIFREIASKIIQ
jgi:NTE family protein